MNPNTLARGSASSRGVIRATLGALLAIAPFMSLARAATPVCALPGNDGATFSDNTYYPGTGTATKGFATVNIGSKRSGDNGNSKDLAVGDLVFIIQMQDATIDNSNSVNYGDGSTGRGYTSLVNSGKYEFARVDAINLGTLTLNKALENTYTSTTAATTTQGIQTFQVIRVPQYTSATLGSVTVTPWNGSTGGVLVQDALNTLTVSGTIDASEAGFRGGGSRQDGDIRNRTDYASPYTTTTTNYGAFKGEGVAGTPRFVRDLTKTAVAFTGTDLGTSGYPIGTVNFGNTTTPNNITDGLDRSRGAPGNAGGGGTQHNAGGGGGSNVGQGGQGGKSFTFASGGGGDGGRDVGGLGGVAITPNFSRILMGGGAGAGDNNNASDNSTTPQASGGNGGGLIFLRASALAGSGTLKANGQNGQPAGRDGAGGGGGGGTVILATASATVPLNIEVNGGKGGNSGQPLRSGELQGTGGGGGGGAVLKPTGTSLTGSVQFAGGAPGTNAEATPNTYGAVAGDGGIGNAEFSATDVPLAADCLPTLEVDKTTGTPTRTAGTDTTATYTVKVSNTSSSATALGVALTDVLPAPFAYSAVAVTPSYVGGSSGPSSVTGSSSVAGGVTTVKFGTAGGTTGNSFTLPPNSSVTLTFTVSLNGAGAGTYQNPARVDFSDPTTVTAGATVTPGGSYASGGAVGGRNYDSASTTLEDVTLSALPLVCTDAIYIGNVTNSNLFRLTPSSGTLSNTGISLTGTTAAIGLTPNATRLFWNSNTLNTASTPVYRLFGYDPTNGTQDLSDQPQDGTTNRTIQRNAVSNDGRAYYGGYTGGSNVFYKYDTTSGATTGPYTLTSQPSSAPAIGNGGDIAFDKSNVGYLIDQPRNLYRLDVNDASLIITATYLGPVTGLANNTNGLAFGSDNNLYASTLNDSNLYTISLSTLVATNITPSSLPTGYAANDLASCFYPDLLPNIGATKSVKNLGSNAATPIANPGKLAEVNDILEYTVIVRNSGNVIAGNATFQDTLPSNTTYVGSSTKLNGAAVSDNGAAPVFPYSSAASVNGLGAGVQTGTLRPDTTPGNTTDNEAVITFQVKVNTNPGTQVSNQGTVKFQNGTVPTDDPGTATPSDPTVRAVGFVDLEIVKTVEALRGSPASYQGVTVRNNAQAFRYVVTAKNVGNSLASAVSLGDVLPTDVQLDSSVSPNTVSTVNGAAQGSYTSGVWTIGDVSSNQTARLEIYVTLKTLLDADGTVTQKTVTNTATLSNGTAGDNNDGNNSASASIVTNPIKLKKYVRNVTAGEAVDTARVSTSGKPGNTLEYCVAASSTLSSSRDVSVSDLLQANQTFVPNSFTGVANGAISVSTVTGTLTAVSSSAPKTMCFNTTVN